MFPAPTLHGTLAPDPSSCSVPAPPSCMVQACSLHGTGSPSRPGTMVPRWSARTSGPVRGFSAWSGRCGRTGSEILCWPCPGCPVRYGGSPPACSAQNFGTVHVRYSTGVQSFISGTVNRAMYTGSRRYSQTVLQCTGNCTYPSYIMLRVHTIN